MHTWIGLTLFAVMINKLLRNWHMRTKYVDDTTAFEIIPRNSINNNNTLFVQYHEQEIPEVIPIEGIPFVNQSKSNQINLTQHKSNQIKSNFGF